MRGLNPRKPWVCAVPNTQTLIVGLRRARRRRGRRRVALGRRDLALDDFRRYAVAPLLDDLLDPPRISLLVATHRLAAGAEEEGVAAGVDYAESAGPPAPEASPSGAEVQIVSGFRASQKS